MTPWQRRKARRNATSKCGEGVVMPRTPSTAYSFLLRVTTVVLGTAGLCAVALCLMRFMTPYYEVLVSYWNLHVRRRLWAQDLQVVADVVGISISLHSEQESRLVLSFLGGVVAWMARAAGDEWVFYEGSTFPMSCLTQRREQCVFVHLVVAVCCRYNSETWFSFVV